MLSFKRGLWRSVAKMMEDMVTKRTLVGLKIYDAQIKGKKPYFSWLVGELGGKVSRRTISKSLDELFDAGMLNSQWEDVNGRPVKVLIIATEFEEVFKKLHELIYG